VKLGGNRGKKKRCHRGGKSQKDGCARKRESRGLALSQAVSFSKNGQENPTWKIRRGRMGIGGGGSGVVSGHWGGGGDLHVKDERGGHCMVREEISALVFRGGGKLKRR